MIISRRYHCRCIRANNPYNNTYRPRCSSGVHDIHSSSTLLPYLVNISWCLALITADDLLLRYPVTLPSIRSIGYRIIRSTVIQGYAERTRVLKLRPGSKITTPTRCCEPFRLSEHHADCPSCDCQTNYALPQQPLAARLRAPLQIHSLLYPVSSLKHWNHASPP